MSTRGAPSLSYSVSLSLSLSQHASTTSPGLHVWGGNFFLLFLFILFYLFFRRCRDIQFELGTRFDCPRVVNFFRAYRQLPYRLSSMQMFHTNFPLSPSALPLQVSACLTALLHCSTSRLSQMANAVSKLKHNLRQFASPSPLPCRPLLLPIEAKKSKLQITF